MDGIDFGEITLDNEMSLDDFDLSMFDRVDDYDDQDVADQLDTEEDFTNAIALDLLLKSGERTNVYLHNDDVTSIIRKHLSRVEVKSCNWLWLENLILWQMGDNDGTLSNFHNIYYVFIFGFSSAPEFFIDKSGKYKHIIYQMNILNGILPHEEDIGLVKGITVNTKKNYIELTLHTDTIKK